MIFIAFLSIGIILFLRLSGLAQPLKHNFEGRCQLCHTEIPPAETPFEKASLVENVDHACALCHPMNQRTSHPVGVKPQRFIPLQRFLDGQGNLSCITCHDVHKEQKKYLAAEELEGLLRGHTKGKAFCYTCHNQEALGAGWRHSLSINYAHKPGELTQDLNGALMDQFSVECLSCHDGVISTMASANIRSGEFRHGSGLSHPVGVLYPPVSVKNDFMPQETLPEPIKLFNGRVGCLSCHNPYNSGKSFLVMPNARSGLCLSCHKK